MDEQTKGQKPRNGDGTVRSPWAAFGILLAIFCLCYAYELTNFTLTLDEEIYAFGSAETWLRLGRWAIYYLKVLVWPQSSTPFGPLLVFGLSSAYGYLTLLRAFGVDAPRAEHFIIFPLFVAFPVWFTLVEFSIVAVGAGPALLACCWAVLLCRPIFHTAHAQHFQFVEGAALIRLLGALVLVTVAIGIYQSFMFFFFVLGLAVSLALYLEDPERRLGAHVKCALFVGGIALLAFVSSFLIGRLAMALHGLDYAPYVDNFVKVTTLIDQPLTVVKEVLRQVFNVYAGYWANFAAGGGVFFAFFALGAVLMVDWRGGIFSRRNITLCATLAVIGLAPFSFNIFSGGVLPLRSFVAVPAIAWLFVFLPLKLSAARPVRKAVMVMAAVAFLQIVYIQSIVQANAWAALQHDILLAGALHERIVEAWGPPTPGERIFVDFHGNLKYRGLYPNIYSATNGASFFSEDRTDGVRKILFMRILGYDELALAAGPGRRAAEAVFAEMPTWPAEGSVRRVGDAVLVKLSEPADGN